MILSHCDDLSLGVSPILPALEIVKMGQNHPKAYQKLCEAYADYLSGKSDVTQVSRRLQSYLGILSHANHHALTQAIKNAYWVRSKQLSPEGESFIVRL